MNDMKTLIDDLNRASISIPITRDTLKTVGIVEKVDLFETIKTINADFKDVMSVSVLFSNITDNQHSPTGAFKVVGIFGPNTAIRRYLALERQETPWATFRILELFEGSFQTFIEYPAVETSAAASE